MKQLRMTLGRVMAGLALVFVLGNAAAPTPAQAAMTITLDDPRDGIQCPGATLANSLDVYFAQIQPLQNNETINLCSGEYLGVVRIHNLSGVKLVGKADPTLGAPRIVPPLVMTSAETWTIIDIANSSNITISGLTLDSIAKFGVNGSTTGSNWGADPFFPVSGIHVSNSTVTIDSNTFIHMKLTADPANNNDGTGVRVEGAATATQAIRVTGNNFFDDHTAGVLINSINAHYQPTITDNVFFTPWTVADDTKVHLQYVTSGTISGNLFQSNWDPISGSNCGGGCGRGIEIEHGQNVRITGNTFNGDETAMLIGSFNRAYPVTGFVVTNNTIMGSRDGVTFLVIGDTSSPLEMSNNSITGNTVSLYMLPYTAAHGIYINDLSGPGGVSYAGNVISGNTVTGYGDGAIDVPQVATKQVKLKRNKLLDFAP